MFLLVLVLLCISSGSSSRPCARQCQCLDHSELVDCRTRGLAVVPHGLPHGTWLLDLGGNMLTKIRSHAFAGLWSLRVLVLVNNSIHELHSQALYSLSFLEKLDMSWNNMSHLPADFSHSLSSLKELHLEHNVLELLKPPILERLESLEKLDLSYNRIRTVEPGAFRGLTRLRHLYLQGNQLDVVSDGMFSPMPSLEVLLLDSNKISVVEVNALSSLHSLSLLSLQGNRLERLKFKTFVNLRSAGTHLQLSANPWKCDCELHRIFSKLLSVRHLYVDDYRNVTCHDPGQLTGESLEKVDSQLCAAETLTVLIITGTVLFTVLGALIKAEHKRKKKRWPHSEIQRQEK
ncbi:slit homolog 2 protein [Trichomycterus rosablanca]|uniref:slit homolog 2 protein n=1 Tax=Trichomycterus rosablanca TaxID=2290929 RepID=UPI002F35A624